MNRKDVLIDFLMSFMVVTSCVTILEGVIGCIFFPHMTLGYGAFFSPPLFGFLSSLLGIVTYSRKELTIAQAFIRKGIHLILIEAMVLGVNAWAGNHYSWNAILAIVIAIAIVYVTVILVLWINDQRSASLFNESLKRYKNRIKENISTKSE